MNRKTGTYDTSSVAGESVKAFVPFPLPPKHPKLVIDDKIQVLLHHAEQKLSHLNLASEMIPSLDWFIYAYVRKEAVTSSQIEGTQATLIDLLSFESDLLRQSTGNADIEEICNYLDAIKYARGELIDQKGLPLSIRLLNETHKRLMKGARGGTKQPGELRRSQNWIGGSRPGTASFVPPPPMLLPNLLGDLEKYIYADDTLHPLIRMGLIHVQFETIHPYLDGNGRMGRLLITLLLEYWHILNAPLLYLSLFFKRNRKDYYRLLSNVRLQGDWEAWTTFFLTGVSEIADEALTLARHLSQIVNEDREKVHNDSTSTLFTVRLFELLPTHPMLTVAQVVKLLDTSKPTALKAIATLERLRILRERTGRKRDRCFEYTDYLVKLKFGTELKMYRVVIDYAWEFFVIKDGHVDYESNAGHHFFYESLAEAEACYAAVLKKLKKIPSIRAVEIKSYETLTETWEDGQSALLSAESEDTLLSSDLVKDKRQSLQAIIQAQNLLKGISKN